MKKLAIPAGAALLILLAAWFIMKPTTDNSVPETPLSGSTNKLLPVGPSPQPEQPLKEGPAQPQPSPQKAEAKVRFQQGLNFASTGKIDAAVQEFSEAIRLDPDYTVAYGNRAVAYIQQKKYNKAREDLTKTVSLDPTDRVALYNLTIVHTLQKDLDLALDTLDKALEKGFNNYDELRNNPELAPLRKNPEFRKILERHKIFL